MYRGTGWAGSSKPSRRQRSLGQTKLPSCPGLPKVRFGLAVTSTQNDVAAFIILKPSGTKSQAQIFTAKLRAAPIGCRRRTRKTAPLKNILVTGGSGFIGSHLTEALLAQGHRVLVVDDLSTGSADNLAHLRSNDQLEVVNRDIGNPQLVAELVERSDVVYHLAAAVGVALIAKQPIQTIERNIYPTQLILSELQRQILTGRKIPMFLASTSEVYGKNPKEVWSEGDDLVFGSTTKPRWSYGASKAIDEFLALAYHREYQLPIVIGRFFNVVGPRQTGAYGMVLPRLIDSALKNDPLIVHDDGQQVRCFAHVHDVVGAVLQLMAEPTAAGRVFNIGSDNPVSILELAQHVCRLVNPEAKIEFQSYRQAYDDDFEDIRRRVPDLSRLRSTIDYQPKHSLESIIRDVHQHLRP